jgi:hypothetical protein
VDSQNLKTFSLFILATLLSCGCAKAIEKIKCSDSDPKTGTPIFARQTFQSGLVNYRGVSFTFSPSIQAEVVAETRCAVPLDEQSHGVFYEYHPEHRAFVFAGNYATQHNESFFSEPEIRIYPIDEYRAIINQSEDLRRIIDREFESLKEALNKKTTSFTYEAPFVAVLEAGQLFQAKVKYVRFRNGNGILYLTYFCNDPLRSCEINNQALSYIFQGLTDDGRYFIYVTFPVKTNSLPLSDPPEDEFGCSDPKGSPTFDEMATACKKFGQKVGSRLEPLPAGNFEPSLDLFDQLIQSLSVTPH